MGVSFYNPGRSQTYYAAQAGLKLAVPPTHWYYRLPSAMPHCVYFFNLHTALIVGCPVPILQMEKQRLKKNK